MPLTQATRKTQGNDMGDKPPKSTQKKSSQKQAKASSAAAAKKAAVSAKQAAGKNWQLAISHRLS